MKLYNRIFVQLFFVGILVTSCKDISTVEKAPLLEEINEIKQAYAPDKRVALFSISANKNKDTYILKGESNVPKAVQAFKNLLKEKDVSFIDSIAILPTKVLKNRTKGVVTVSVANIRSNPKHSAELATQATLGTPVNILKIKGDWILIQTPDKYISWVDYGAIVPYSVEGFLEWKKTNKVIYTNTNGFVYSSPDMGETIVSDIVAGGILQLLEVKEAFYKVGFPDGREGYLLKSEAQEYSSWQSIVIPKEEELVATSKKFMGLPYLWGGTSTKGVDCSGFTKSIYFLNGMVIPRDASQQVHTGLIVDSVKNFKSLRKGDLLFFGRKKTDSTKQKVVHVGMWIGNKEFIHASGSGRVQIGSVEKNSANFDAFNVNRYLCTKRLLRAKDSTLVHLKSSSIFTY